MKVGPVLCLLLVLSALSAAAQAPSPAAANCASSQGALPKSFEGQAYAVSGDTLAAVGLKPDIGLWGIKAPEMNGGSVAGMRARAALEDVLIASEHRVSCRIVGWDRTCRALAQCTITAQWPAGSAGQAHDIGLRLVEDGWAYGVGLNVPPAWDKDAGEKIAHFEQLARQAHKGLWPDWLGEQPRP
jgi:endonuclease YncB( thermonuclease family)